MGLISAGSPVTAPANAKTQESYVSKSVARQKRCAVTLAKSNAMRLHLAGKTSLARTRRSSLVIVNI